MVALLSLVGFVSLAVMRNDIVSSGPNFSSSITNLVFASDRKPDVGDDSISAKPHIVFFLVDDMGWNDIG